MPPKADDQQIPTPILALLLALALSSLALGARHALLYASHDLQWGGSVLLSHGIDPWAERLANYPHHQPHFSPPNYLHLLYLLLLPLAHLPFQTAEVLWCTGSILASVAAVALLARGFRLTRPQALLALALLWMSSPFRVVLEVGQISLFELLAFSLTFLAAAPALRGLAFGLTLIKYSFAPTAAVDLLLRRRYAVLAIATAVCLLGALGCHLLLPATPTAQLLREPLLVSRIAVSPGLADWMTLSEYALRPLLGLDHAKSASYALALVASLAYAAWISRFRLAPAAELTLLSLASLLFLKHLLYDYVFLLIPLCWTLSIGLRRASAPILAGIAFFWYLAFFANRAANDLVVHLPALALNTLILTALLVYTTTLALHSGRPISRS